MTVTAARLYSGTPAVGPATVYTAPAGGADILVIVGTNASAGGQALTITVAGVNVWGGKVIPANDFVRMAGPIHLAGGETISVASPSGVPSLTISGIEHS